MTRPDGSRERVELPTPTRHMYEIVQVVTPDGTPWVVQKMLTAIGGPLYFWWDHDTARTFGNEMRAAGGSGLVVVPANYTFRNL